MTDYVACEGGGIAEKDAEQAVTPAAQTEEAVAPAAEVPTEETPKEGESDDTPDQPDADEDSEKPAEEGQQ